MSEERQHIAIIYDAFPHYRKGIIEELSKSPKFAYYFFGDSKYEEPSIKLYTFNERQNAVTTNSFSIGSVYVQNRIFLNVLKKRISQCIFLGNPFFFSTWIWTPILRLMGREVYFWTHGWISVRESPIKRVVRNLYLRLPNGLFVYGHRSKLIGESQGFAPSRLHVIGNSLDYESQKAVFNSLGDCSQATLRASLGLPPHSKLLICTARVTKKCRFDILIYAMSLLRLRGHDLFLLIVGDGPEKKHLSALAASLSIGYKFWGECYEELIIAKLYKCADLTVSPGKVGLTAIHSMTYGTPVISHNNLDHQMPEFEAITPGITGDLFDENSSESLASVIEKWFREHPSKPEAACFARVEAEFTPAFQRCVIERVLMEKAR